MRRILCWLFSFTFLLPLSAHAAETRGVKRVEIKTQAGELVGLYEQSHALVIGVSNYTGGWPRLRGVREDVARCGRRWRTKTGTVLKIQCAS